MIHNIGRLRDRIKRTVLCHTGLVMLSVMVCFANAAFGEDADKISTIHVVTPTFQNIAHEDGTGLSFDIIRNVYEPAGITMTYEIVPWKRAATMIQSNRADAMPGVQAGTATLIPTHPIDSLPICAVFKKETMPTWAGLPSLDGKRAVWMRGYDFQKNSYLQGFHVQWEEVDEFAEAWFMVERGTTDFYIETLPMIEMYIAANQVDRQPYRVEPLWQEKLYLSLADSEKSKTLIDIYDRRIIELLKSGELQTLFEKWNVPFPSEIWQE